MELIVWEQYLFGKSSGCRIRNDCKERVCKCKDNFVTQLVCGRTKDREWKGGFE